MRTTLSLILISLSLAPAQDDPARLIRAKDVSSRLHAVRLLAEAEREDGEKLLRTACKDRDWEVAWRATEALGKRGTKDSVKALAELAVKHPLLGVRRAAVRALNVIDHDAAVQALVKRLKGRTRQNAAEALAFLGDPGGWKRFSKLLQAKEPPLRWAALEGLAGTGDPRALKTIVPFLTNGDVTTRAAAVRALLRLDSPDVVPLLLDRLTGGKCRPVMEREIIRRLAAHIASKSSAERGPLVTACLKAFDEASGRGQAAAVRLLAALGGGEEPVADRARMVEKLVAARGSEATVAAALAVVGGEAALKRLGELAREPGDERVRTHALRAVGRVGGEGAAKVLTDVLGSEAPDAVREMAAVQCGRLLAASSRDALVGALASSSWRVVLAAAVSVGKLQDEAAVPALVKLLDHADFRMRAAGAVGLGWSGRKSAVEPLIRALGDGDPLVRATAHDFLRRITKGRDGPVASKWRKWWTQASDGFRFNDRRTARRGAEDEDRHYDRFRRDPYGVFKDFLVIVLGQSRDKMEKTLEAIGIEHVMTRTGKVHESGIHSNAVFLANCPGNLDPDDAQRLEWFVRSGGHLFATCVALSNTVMKLFPGTVAPPNRGGAPGPVNARPVDRDDDYLRGVFGPHARPRYQLAGNQLPAAVDRDLVGVLVESTEACTRWGSGTLASWFPAGHGIVVHSANHFVLQGMERLKSEAERRAFALERLGISFRRVRELDARGTFRSQTKAAKACRDETMMRLVARFVYTKRRGE